MRAVSVIGAGAWGTALARVLSEGERKVVLYTRRKEHAEALRHDRENRAYLPGFSLSERVWPTASLSEAVRDMELVVVAVPSSGMRSTLEELAPFLSEQAALVSAVKGIETESLMLMSEVAKDVLGAAPAERFSVLSGPSFAQEVARGLPTNVVVASDNDAAGLALQERFSTERFRVYTSSDVPGVEVGGALKNVIAIAAGACDGLGFGHNTRAGLITRGLAELARLAMAKRANPLTLAGLSGLGDLVLTCGAELSRNRTVGFEMAKGRSLRDVLASLGHVAEGVVTAHSAYHLSKKLGVDLPISNEVYHVLYQGKSVQDALRAVLARPLRKELG